MVENNVENAVNAELMRGVHQFAQIFPRAKVIT